MADHFTEYEIDPSDVEDAWIAAEWDDAWHPAGTDLWEFIAEVMNDALDYLDDGGYLG